MMDTPKFNFYSSKHNEFVNSDESSSFSQLLYNYQSKKQIREWNNILKNDKNNKKSKEKHITHAHKHKKVIFLIQLKYLTYFYEKA